MKLARWGKEHRFWIIDAIAIAAALVVLLLWRIPAPVHAQAQAGSFSVSFSAPYHTTSVKSYVSIPNRDQAGDTVSYVFSAGCNGTGDFELDGSNDGTTWFVLAVGYIPSGAGKTSGTIYSNGYYAQKRIAIQNCATLSSGSLTGVYTGYPTPLPLNINTSESLPTASINDVVFNSGSNFIIQGFQCFNPNTSTTYLQIAESQLFTPMQYEIGIPQGQTFTYSGPPIISFGSLNAYSSSALNSQAPATLALVCTFQVSASGPFYPNNPLSAL